MIREITNGRSRTSSYIRWPFPNKQHRAWNISGLVLVLKSMVGVSRPKRVRTRLETIDAPLYQQSALDQSSELTSIQVLKSMSTEEVACLPPLPLEGARLLNLL